MRMSWKYSSPNFSSRYDTIVDTIIVHHTAGMMPGCAGWLCNPNPKDEHGNPVGRVSAHVVIGRDGLVYELVKPEHCAWHAGRGAFDYDKNSEISEEEKTFNRRSLGIELESMGEEYTDEQMFTLPQVIHYYRKSYLKIKTELILGHKEIAKNRGKWDPGHFNMSALRQSILAFRRIRE